MTVKNRAQTHCLIAYMFYVTDCLELRNLQHFLVGTLTTKRIK